MRNVLPFGWPKPREGARGFGEVDVTHRQHGEAIRVLHQKDGREKYVSFFKNKPLLLVLLVELFIRSI